MEEMKVYKCLNLAELKLGLPIWTLYSIWFMAFTMIVLFKQIYFIFISLALHFFCASLVKFVDLFFMEILRSYISQPKGDLE